MATNSYRPADFGKKESPMIQKFQLQLDDARTYFQSCIKPRLDRAYKLYMAYNGDRSKEIKKWQANIFVPYIHAVVETLMPRILDARPDFTVQGRNEDDQYKAEKLQNLGYYTWEIANMDDTSEMLVRSALIYGSGYLQVYWKKDVRSHKFLSTKDLTDKKYTYEDREQTFYDAPYAEWVDNYDLWYDWRNVPRECKQFWFKRRVLTGAEIKRRYPNADKKRLKLALANPGGDLSDYGSIRNEIKFTHEEINKGSDYNQGSTGDLENKFQTQSDNDLKMYEVFEWWRPFDDEYAVMVNEVPILKGGSIPIPYDFKEAPFINFPYLKLPNEFEGSGLPLLLENPQIMVNMVKNQRLDAMTLNIHKMWIVNPLANIDKKELVTRPFGIIYSTDPNGVKEVQFSDVKSSAYREEELLKSDMRYASGVDDFSMGVGGGAGSATEVRHLRESTLERVRLFVNHLGSGFSQMQRYWMSMWKQFYTEEMVIRIVGDDGNLEFPLIEKDDLMGEFDFKSSVLPSIAGKNDIDKKQGMDLFQLLVNLPFIDPRKLTSKLLYNWDWNIDSITSAEAEAPQMPEGMSPEGMPPGMPPGMSPQGMPQGMAGGDPAMQGMPNIKGSGDIPASTMKEALAILAGGGGGNASPFAEAGSPINLLQQAGVPPTAPSIDGKTANLRGLNKGGKVNTNINTSNNSSEESQLLGRAANIQK